MSMYTREVERIAYNQTDAVAPGYPPRQFPSASVSFRHLPVSSCRFADLRFCPQKKGDSCLRSFAMARHHYPRKAVVTYFIQREDGGPIKIGTTINIKTRLTGMQGSSPVTLVCIAIINGDREAELHARFHHLRICGEWFEPSRELMDFISADARKTCISRPLWTPALGQRFAAPHSRKKLGAKS